LLHWLSIEQVKLADVFDRPVVDRFKNPNSECQLTLAVSSALKHLPPLWLNVFTSVEAVPIRSRIRGRTARSCARRLFILPGSLPATGIPGLQ